MKNAINRVIFADFFHLQYRFNVLKRCAVEWIDIRNNIEKTILKYNSFVKRGFFFY